MIDPRDIKLPQQAPRATAWWGLLFGVLLIEFVLCYVIPADVLSRSSVAAGFVRAMSTFAPVVHNFDRIAAHPEALSLYYGIALWLIIPKTMFWYWWLHSDEKSNAKYFIITPLTRTRPANSEEFAAASFYDFSANERPRSSASAKFWSTMTLLLWIGFGWITLVFGFQVADGGGWTVEVGFKIRAEQIASGPPGAWLWPAIWLTFFAFWTAIAFTVMRDIFAKWQRRKRPISGGEPR